MKKQPIIEDAMKTVIRDELALRPFASVHKIQVELFVRGFRSVSERMLDWHYVAKIIKKVRIENLVKLSREDRTKRLAFLKERHRILTEKLIPIVEGDMVQTPLGASYPTQRDRIAAANVIMKWDMALLFAEEQIQILNQQNPNKEKRITTKALILMDTMETTRSLSLGFQNQSRNKRIRTFVDNPKNIEKVS